MGSPDPIHARQLNGMGGGVSSLSKICVVGEKGSLTGRSECRDDIDVEYTFAQVGIRDEVIDYSGNCGNLSSVVGVFAVDEGMCSPRVIDNSTGQIHSRGTVRLFNTNTNKHIDTTFPLTPLDSDGLSTSRRFADLGIPEESVAGVPGLASRIDLDFTNPAGARTGKLFPTGNVQEDLHVRIPPDDTLNVGRNRDEISISATLIDAANPSVFIRHDDLVRVLQDLNILSRPTIIDLTETIDFSLPPISKLVECIRRTGAKHMGLDPSIQAQPKIAIARSTSASDSDVYLTSFSMGVPHKAVPMTLGLCAGVAAGIEGTIVWDTIARTRRNFKKSNPGVDFNRLYQCSSAVTETRLEHPSGVVDVGAVFETTTRSDHTQMKVLSARVVRTGRRLMQGLVWW